MAQFDVRAGTAQITIESEDVERPEIVLRHFDFDLERGAAPEEEKGVDYPVWFATNRKPEANGGFGGERGNSVTRGRAVVHVPKAHRFGETGSGFFKRLIRGDDRLRVKDIVAQAMDVFYGGVRKEIEAALKAGDEPEALVFLHGYNVSFEDAAIRAAQIGYDLKVPGPVAFFSWPSRGSLAAYPADEASIEASEQPIADFLVEFAQNCKAGDTTPKLHLIAIAWAIADSCAPCRASPPVPSCAERCTSTRSFLPRRTSTAISFSVSPRSIARTQTALRSMPPAEIWRCICRRNCMTRRAPAISCLTQ
jgi:hypothetical protein